MALYTANDTSIYTTKQLGGTSYTLNPARLAEEKTSSSLVIRVAKGLLAVVALPIRICLVPFTTTFMYFGSKRLKNKLIAWFIPLICNKADQMLEPERRILLKDCQGTVLDVGSGGGAYMRYFQQADKVVAVEPIVEMHSKILQAAKQAGIHDKLTVAPVDLETFCATQQETTSSRTTVFDWIVLGNVLCEVLDPKVTLKVVDRLLKPGSGRVYFCEHVACPRSTWKRQVQEWINPWWHIVSGGCNCQRESLRLIQNMPGWEVISWEISSMQIALGPFVIGLARKQETKEE